LGIGAFCSSGGKVKPLCRLTNFCFCFAFVFGG
jgi:hypothetical protein